MGLAYPAGAAALSFLVVGGCKCLAGKPSGSG